MAKRIQTEPALCRDCQVCSLGCSLHHEGECNLQLARLAVTKDMERYEFHITVCRQCDPAECLLACPADAVRRDEDGVVHIEQETCIACGACAEACPYDAIIYHDASHRFLKCDLCTGRAGGPYCVALCPVGALKLAEA